MNVEVRGETVFITGYVNAIERYSKPITDTLRGKVQTFIERIKAGVFKTALKRNNDVKVLLNHDMNRELANTKDGSAKLEEDNIGLRAEVIITDKEVVEKARQNRLVGWSFGFYPNADEVGAEGNNTTRTLTDLDLVEVSILDDTKSPAYYGTSIEARCEGGKRMAIREEVLNEEEVQEEVQEEEVKEETQSIDIEALAEIVANKVVAMLTEQKAEETEEEVQEEEVQEETEEETAETEETETEEKADAEAEEEVEEEEETENRAIDYSAFENRIANL
jgi:HK97 family phage prohead protease